MKIYVNAYAYACPGHAMRLSRVKDGTEGKNTPASKTIYDFLRQLLIRNHTDTLGLELVYEAIRDLDDIRFTVFASVVNNSLGTVLQK